jgi:hypothetical protein
MMAAGAILIFVLLGAIETIASLGKRERIRRGEERPLW